MGCCGEPANQPDSQGTNRSIATGLAVAGKPVVHQPSPQSNPSWQEKPTFQAPGIATPPPVLQHGQNSTSEAWHQQGQQEAQFDPYASLNRTASPPAGSATLVNGSTNGHGYPPTSPSPPFGQAQTPPLMQPNPVYMPSTSMTVTSRHSVSPGQSAFIPPSDEGKLSVSIDFGTRLLIRSEVYRLLSAYIFPGTTFSGVVSAQLENSEIGKDR